VSRRAAELSGVARIPGPVGDSIDNAEDASKTTKDFEKSLVASCEFL
jgi:hypothetical protein